jgi:ABC-type multidrug transport system fused ATPase/permease subunit
MKNAAGRMLKLLSTRDRRRMMLVLGGMIVAALASAAGVASILPFLTLVGDPTAVQSNAILSWLYTALGFSSVNRFLILVGLLVLVVLVACNAIRAVVNWAVLRFTWMRNHSLSKRLLASYLHRPYVFFLAQNTSTLGRNILAEVQNAVNGVLLPSMQIVSNGLIALVILGYLMLVDPFIAVMVGGLLGILYGAIYYVLRRRLRTIGRERLEANRLRYKIATEAFGTMKTVKTLGVESFFADRYAVPSFRFADRSAQNAVIGVIPRYALETLAFGGILVIVLYLLSTQRGLGQMLPLLGVYAFAGYRMMPALQSIFTAFTRIRFAEASLEVLEDDLKEAARMPKRERQAGTGPPLGLTQALELKSVTFRYPGTSSPAVRNISMRVPAGASVAIVGPTGSGKTTIVDLILGLLNPEEGEVLVDGRRIDDAGHRAWLNSVGYVPQEIYLQDDTVTRNIAFGVADRAIRRADVERAARVAQIHDFITTELPEGYETIVGERGIRLSGGERQRIGIARTFYHNPSVMVLDEATSALDGATEDRLYRALQGDDKTITLIIIAHRLSTVKDCQALFVVDAGRIVGQGTYEELMATSELFRAMAKKESS